MVETLVSLFAHQAWADSQLLSAVRAHPSGSEDSVLRELLHHIYVVQVFFHSRLLSEPFDSETVMRKPDSLQQLIPLFRDVHRKLIELSQRITEEELTRTITISELPGGSRTVQEILLQVVMHSQGHRAQAATRLRELGGKPPTLDYILWCQLRPAPVYPG